MPQGDVQGGQSGGQPGAVGLVFIAQGGDGGGTAVPELGGFLKCLRAAVADQGAADAGKKLLDRGEQISGGSRER